MNPQVGGAFPGQRKDSSDRAAARTLDDVARRRPAAQAKHIEPGEIGPPWWVHLAFVVVSGLSILLAYRNSFGPGFDRRAEVNWTLDNKYIIQLDPRSKVVADLFDPSTWRDPLLRPSFLDIWTRDYWWPKGISGLYRPIVTFTYWLNWSKMSGDESKIAAQLSPQQREEAAEQIMRGRLRVFHAVNYFVHWLTTVLLYMVALMLTRRWWIAAATGLLFGLHPVAVESVTNIIGRADIFAAITTLGGLLLFVAATRARGWMKLPWLFSLGVLTTLGVFSKESAIAVIGAIACYDIVYRVPWRKLWTFDTATQLDLLLLALRIGLIVLLSFALVKTMLDGVLPLLEKWSPAPPPGTLAVGVPTAFVWMLEFCALAFLSLLAATAMLPWAKRQIWIVPLALLPALALSLTMIGLLYGAPEKPPAGDKPARTYLYAWGFLVAAAMLVIQEWLLQPANEQESEPAREPASDRTPAESYAGSRPWRWLSDHYLVFLPIVIILALVRSAIFAATTPPETPFLDNPIRGVNWIAGELTALKVMVKLWGILAWPYNLCCDYSFNQVPVFGRWSSSGQDASAILAAIFVLLVLAATFWLWRRRAFAAVFFVMFFFVTFLPTSNLLLTIGSIMAERFVYLPMVGFVGCLVLAIEWLSRRAAALLPATARQHLTAPGIGATPAIWILTAIVAVVSVVYGTRTYRRNRDWRSDFTLWDAATTVSPVSFRTYQSYAFALFEEVSRPKEKRQPETQERSIDDCIKWIAKGRPIVDQLPDRYNSSRLYMHQGMYYAAKAELLTKADGSGRPIMNPQSEAWYQRAIASFEIARRVDRAFNELNRQKEAMRDKTIEDIPDAGLTQIYDFLGSCYQRLGQFDKALDNFYYIRQLDPFNADAYEKIAAANIAANRAEPAAVALIQELWLDPNRTHLFSTLAQLLQAINPEKEPAVLFDDKGRGGLDPRRRVVRSVVYQAYLSIVRVFLESHRLKEAELMRRAAVRDWGFPQRPFDDIFREFGRKAPEIVPLPPPDAQATLEAQKRVQQELQRKSEEQRRQRENNVAPGAGSAGVR